MYVVVKEGVYIQDIAGLYDKLSDAKKSAIKAIKGERDDYHEMSVVSMPKNKHCKRDKEVYRLKRKGKEIVEVSDECLKHSRKE